MSVTPWWETKKMDAHGTVMEYVAEVERSQCETYERFVRLAAMYDPTGRDGDIMPSNRAMGMYGSTISENLIARNVDTAVASISANKVRCRFQTEDADWSVQRMAKRREWYVEGVVKLLGGDKILSRQAHDMTLKGAGFVKVYPDFEKGRVRAERVLPDDIIVDEGECRSNPSPRQLHHRMIVDKDELSRRFPKFKMKIENAVSSGTGERYWADYRPLERNDVVAVESWHLACGEPDDEYYIPGRRTICIEGAQLLDEEYGYEEFPFVRMVWNERDKGYYGIGLAERIVGHQRRLNKMNWQTDKQRDRIAVPTTYVQLADANLAVKTTNRLGAIAAYRTAVPVTVTPTAVGAEVYQRINDIKMSAQEEVGQSQMQVNATKPAGLESGAALREYRDQTAGRFRIQEDNYEEACLHLRVLVLRSCKELGSDAPVIYRRSRWGSKKIDWSDVDLEEVKLQIAAASSISNTPAGRKQTVLELAQAGVITQDESRRLLGHPDLERAMSLYTAAIEDLERCLEDIYDGGNLVPEPAQNLKMGLWRFQQAYLKARADGAPEEILENIRTWFVTAGWMLSLAEQPPQPAMPPVGAPGEVPPGEALPPGPGHAALPGGPAPMSAFAPESIGVTPA